MILWLILAALALLALALVLTPLLRSRGAAPARADYDIEVYIDQLGELDRDTARGAIGAEDAGAARIEIERRMLAAERARQLQTPGAMEASRSRIITAFVLAFAVPAAALVVYGSVGSPGLPGVPFAERPTAAGNDALAQTDERIVEAEAFVRDNPDNARGWYNLGRLMFFARQSQRAIEAFAEASRLAPDRIDFLSAWGEALVIAAEGQVTPQARGVFDRALTGDPTEARARFYVALADQQAGRREEALDSFVALLRDAPADAPWRTPVEVRARALAAELGKDVDALFGSAATARRPGEMPRGPDADDVAAAQQMAPEERSAMIRNMVEGLAARLEDEPGDVEGWRRLGRSWGVLGEHEKSSEAYTRALALEPDHPETLLGAASAAEAAGERQTALNLFTRLRASVPEGTAAHTELLQSIERLQSGAKAPEIAARPAPSASTPAPAPPQPRGPTRSDVESASQMAPEERMAMIRGMVEGLASRLKEQPGDVEGWRRLGRSWETLGEHDNASQAYGRALELAPDHPETLFRAAVAASDAGDTQSALTRFRRLRTMIPEGVEARGAVDRAIERLEQAR